MQGRIFYGTCLGFVFGVLVRSFVAVDFYLAVFALSFSFILILFTSFIKLKWPARVGGGVVISIFIFAFSLGILRFNFADNLAPDVFEAQAGQKVSLQGEIIDAPDIRENNQKLIVEAKVYDEKTRVLVTTNFSEYFKYGDQVNFSGKLEKPENFITDQGKEFDYINYLRKDGVLYVVNYGEIAVLSRGHGNKIKSGLLTVKEKFLEKMNFAIRAPENLLMGGLILGEKSAFSQDLRQNFVDTGTIHIVALSGYNITIVAEWIMKLFIFLPQNLGIGVGIFSILLFVLMTGWSSTALRAGIMAILVLIARATGRNYDVVRALLLAGVFMILMNPFILVYDVSFQLSFIATVAVILFIYFLARALKVFLLRPNSFSKILLKNFLRQRRTGNLRCSFDKVL
ncbi:ComEC/Rec2 family competence protein, partial [Candidatus Nomurabacteria bacterium]|nr:ComEC/Rec2 family competence protein [Candidatus Nomurabacteria bacterium]